MPVGDAPHKKIEGDVGREERFQLCRLAFADQPWLEVSRREIERGGPSYSVDTLRELQAESPDDELFFVMGGDAARSLAQWREPEAVLSLATVAVVERELDRREQARAALDGLRGSEQLVFVDMPTIDISSTMVRERVAAGRPIRYLVPTPVADRIERAGLYRESVRA